MSRPAHVNIDRRETYHLQGRLPSSSHLLWSPSVTAVTISQISQTYNISRNRHPNTLREKNGGLRLAKSPEEINVGALVRSTEMNLDNVACFGPKSQCAISQACVLKAHYRGRSVHSWAFWMNTHCVPLDTQLAEWLLCRQWRPARPMRFTNQSRIAVSG